MLTFDPPFHPLAAGPAPPGWVGGPRRALLALAGQEAERGAVVMAAALAREHGTTIAVLTVLEPEAVPPGTTAPAARPLDRLRRERVRELLREVDARTAAWPLHVAAGSVPARVAGAAAAAGADIVLLGRGRTAAGTWSARPAPEVALLGPAPVLSVADAVAPPRRIVVSVALDELALHTTAAVRRLWPGVTVDLVHVRGPDGTSDAEIAAQLDRLALVVRAGVRHPPSVARTVLRGPVPQALLAHVERSGAGALAVGLHGALYPAQHELTRSAVLHLLEHAGCPVLVAAS